MSEHDKHGSGHERGGHSAHEEGHKGKGSEHKNNDHTDRNESKHEQENKSEMKTNSFVILSILLTATIFVMAFNFLQQTQVSSLLERQTALLSITGIDLQGNIPIDMSDWTDEEKMNYEMHGIIPSRAGTNTGPVSANFSEVIPKGVPEIYGQELGVSYDDVSVSDSQKANAAIAKLAAFDTPKSGKFITLEGDKKQRYISIVSQISCEYCCGAKSIIFDNGESACGCAHSYSMRGLAKYLIQNHASEFTDDQILEELGKWKTLYFPSILAQKAAVLKQKGIEINYINLASNKYRGIEKESQTGSSGSMVGGC